LAARDPYREAAEASFKMVIDSISFGFKFESGFALVPYLLVFATSLKFAASIATPSIT
jgi:hypothetical protein